MLHADSVGDLTVNPTSLSFPKSASTKEVEVRADGEVSATSTQTWATATVADGKISVSVTANTGAQRTATLTVTDGNTSKEVSITQAAGN